MCTTGTNGLRGCNTSETPVAKNGFPATSAGVGGRMPSRASRSLAICADLSVAADPGFAVSLRMSDASCNVRGGGEGVGAASGDAPVAVDELGSTAEGYLSPHTAEKLQPAFSK